MKRDRNRVIAVVQARLGSVRMPRKVLSEIDGRPSLLVLTERLCRAKSVDQVLLAIPASDENRPLVEFARGRELSLYQGDEFDVLDRFYRAAKSAAASIVVRITGDCPFVDPEIVDELVTELITRELDWVATGSTYPDGFDVEVCTMAALEQGWSTATGTYDREHVMPFVRRSFPRHHVKEFAEDLSHIRLTLDEPVDLTVINAVYGRFGHDRFGIHDIAQLVKTRPELFTGNRMIFRNEGAAMSTGQKLWKRAKSRIPGGGMLLSKRAEMHLPTRWPAYFSRASGCFVWDLDERRYVDFGFMGIGTNILGYGYPSVDEAVIQTIKRGNLSTLNCPEEVELAERLVELHPWADQVRYTRSGGEACAVAVRIARAASGKDGVAICGYHGWHDWYLSANLADDEALDGHLLPGLEPRGVPRALVGLVRPFEYNNLASLEAVLTQGNIGVIFMEVERAVPPAPGFLAGARELATRYGAVLVFDECTSGFRKVLGGTHLLHGVNPDLVILGKTLGNGYAINAVLGRAAVMEAAQATFISSTFWTERIGPTAALAALSAMAAEDAPARIDRVGMAVRGLWDQIATAAGLKLKVAGMPALSTYSFDGFDPAVVKTYVGQEMLKVGYLSATAVYASIAHEEHIDHYSQQLSQIWQRIARLGEDAAMIREIEGGIAHSGFKRLA